MDDKQLIVTMDVEDETGQSFRADVTISVGELRKALRSHNLDIYEK